MTVVSSGTVSLQKFFEQDRVLVIPPWQREYKWGSGDSTNRDQVNRLLEDLSEFATSSASQYFMGLLTLTHTQISKDDKKALYIVDGQQRAVTMQIFLMCCYEFLSRKNSARIPVSEVSLYADLEKLVSFPSSHGTPGLRLQFDQPKANTILETIYTWMKSPIADSVEKNKLFDRLSGKSTTQENLLEVRQYFTDELNGDNSTEVCPWFGGDVSNALKKIITGLTFIELQISDEQEAMDIYHKMNSRGMSLDSADLIKNQLFAFVQDDKNYDDISDHWNNMTESLRGHKSNRFKDPVFMVRSFAGTLWGRPHREKELASTFGKYLSGKESVDQEDLRFLRDPLKFAQELSTLAQKSVTYTAENSSYPLLVAAQKIGAVQHFPLVLAGTYLHSEPLRKHFYNQVGARAILQILAKEHPPHVENIYPSWAAQIFECRKTENTGDLDSIFQRYAFRRGEAEAEEIQAYKADLISSLDSQVASQHYAVSSQKRKIAFLLAILSWYLDQRGTAEHSLKINDYLNMKSVDPDTGKTVKWELDHIAANAIDSDPATQDSKQRIGNLVLLNSRKNRGAGANPPADKKTIYTVNSTLILTKITDHDTFQTYKRDLQKMPSFQLGITKPWDLSNWTQISILNRTEYLQALLKELLLL